MGTSTAASVSAAATHLRAQHGMRILDQAWSCADGTLDLIAVRERTLVACVVRPRKGALTAVKRSRVRRLAVRWVIAKGVLFDEIRVDAIATGADGSGRTVVAEHMEGI